MRDALSALFNIERISIPIVAPPGKPPRLPRGMGFISISNCKDAFIIGWYHEKIRIDIERSDRDFNYQKLARKYFQKKDIKNFKMNKYLILKEWSAIEAAIKCDRGTLSKDLKEWKYRINKGNLYHKSKKIKLNLTQIVLSDWTISIAYKNNVLFKLPKIICSNL